MRYGLSSVRAEPVEARARNTSFDKLRTKGIVRTADLGMTLVEMLIVLAIIGIASGGVALAIVPSLIAWSAIFMLVSRIG